MRRGAVLLVLLAGCASNPVLQDSERLFADGRQEEAIALLEKASRENPKDQALRMQLSRQRDLAIGQWLAQADALRQGYQIEPAEYLYRRVLALDGGNSRAKSGLQALQMERRHRLVLGEAELLLKVDDVAGASAKVRGVLVENPLHRDARQLQRRIDEKAAAPVEMQQLKTAFNRRVTLDFRDANLRSVFEAISRTAGVNFVFDRDVRPDLRTTLSVKDTTIEDVVKMVLVTNQLTRKVLNQNTVIVFPNTPQKLRDYQELTVRSFYLANADVKQTLNMIRTLVKTRDVFIDEKLNLLVMKDTPDAIRMAERLIAAQDLAEPEVMLEVEVLEVGTNRLTELGLRYPDSVSWSLIGGGAATVPGTPGVISLTEWLNRDSGMVRLNVTNPLFILSLRQQDGSTNLLANPRIRVRNREKAKIHIGERVPVITTTAAASGGFVSESVSYLDIGLKLEVEPNISIDDDVAMKVALEVSNIVKEVRSLTSSTLTYQIGTRNATTVLRLRDGETQVLAGLITDEDRQTAAKVPGLGDLPVVGRLFGSNSTQRNRTELVLLITPRLLRTVALPEARVAEFPAGTETATGAAPLTSSAPPAAGPGAPRPGAAAPGIAPVTPQAAPVRPLPGSPAVPQVPGGTP